MKRQNSVVLGCMADGTKLKPMVVFKRKTMLKEKFPKGVLMHVHLKGWVDDEGCKLWINQVWINRSG